MIKWRNRKKKCWNYNDMAPIGSDHYVVEDIIKEMRLYSLLEEGGLASMKEKMGFFAHYGDYHTGPQSFKVLRLRDSGGLSRISDICIIFPPKSQLSRWKKTQKIRKNQRWFKIPQKFCPDRTWHLYMWIHVIGQYAQNFHKMRLEKIPAQRRWSGSPTHSWRAISHIRLLRRS